MIAVEGIILVLSCHKHMNTRLKKFKLKKNNYENWKVIYVIGNLFIDSDYKLEGDMLTNQMRRLLSSFIKKI